MYMRLYEILDIIEVVKMLFFIFKYLKVELKKIEFIVFYLMIN